MQQNCTDFYRLLQILLDRSVWMEVFPKTHLHNRYLQGHKCRHELHILSCATFQQPFKNKQYSTHMKVKYFTVLIKCLSPTFERYLIITQKFIKLYSVFQSSCHIPGCASPIKLNIELSFTW